jgi:hypothetical protein
MVGQLVAEGLSSPVIAARLGVSLATITTDRKSLGVVGASPPRREPAGSVFSKHSGLDEALDAETGELLLAVECWCTRKVVLCPVDEVRDGLTRSCGHHAC